MMAQGAGCAATVNAFMKMTDGVVDPGGTGSS